MKLAQFALISVIFSGSLFAQDIKIVGTITQPVRVPDTPETLNTSKRANSTLEKITLLKVELSEKAKQALATKAKNALAHTKQFAANTQSPFQREKVELGMNNVPVLNQGMHGTCVTFAVTAALDAIMNRGDYVSQLCSLQLGNYLQKNAYLPSGWDGSWQRIVLNQIVAFGVVSKEQQQSQGCGGLTDYPMNETAEILGTMSVEDYRQVSENLNEHIVWTPILDLYQAVLDRVDIDQTVNQVKTALNEGDRLTFGVLLIDFDLGFAGAVGKKQVEGDTWVLTPEIARDVYLRPFFGGHEMVITGYDDNAVALDDKGREHHGLFTLRNSWGPNVGDQGNFYMSYDYFKLLAIEVARLRRVNMEDR